MNAGTRSDHDLFAPSMPGGRKRAVALAVLAHLALIAALTWGVNWKTSADQPAVEAELWSAVPQQAAPHPVAPPPPPAPVPTPAPAPTPAPPPPKVEEPPQPSEADIALEREKKRKEAEKKHQAQLEQQKRTQEEKARHEQEELQKQQALAAQQAKAKAEQEKQRKLADEKRKADAEAKRAEALRQDQLKRMQSLANATSSGTAATTTSPRQGKNGGSGSSTSAGYGGMVAAKVKPNIVFPDSIAGNPRAEVEVRASPDGTIVGVRLSKSSGNPAWDEAVVRALYKTETLPRDIDGSVPSSLIIGFRPKD